MAHDVQVGRMVNAVRISRDLRQADVAARASVSGTTVSRLERGLIDGMTVAATSWISISRRLAPPFLSDSGTSGVGLRTRSASCAASGFCLFLMTMTLGKGRGAAERRSAAAEPSCRPNRAQNRRIRLVPLLMAATVLPNVTVVVIGEEPDGTWRDRTGPTGRAPPRNRHGTAGPSCPNHPPRDPPPHRAGRFSRLVHD